jgi:hypothetical protein
VRAPNGIRTRATALKGRRPGPLDDEGANRIMLAPLVDPTSIGDDSAGLQHATGNRLARVEFATAESVLWPASASVPGPHRPVRTQRVVARCRTGVYVDLTWRGGLCLSSTTPPLTTRACSLASGTTLRPSGSRSSGCPPAPPRPGDTVRPRPPRPAGTAAGQSRRARPPPPGMPVPHPPGRRHHLRWPPGPRPAVRRDRVRPPLAAAASRDARCCGAWPRRQPGSPSYS